MKKILFIIVLSSLMLFSKEINVVFSNSTPPYAFKNGTGIVLTLVKEALNYKGHKINPLYANMGRAFELFRDGHVDANPIIQTSSGLKAFYSNDFMQYHNAAFVLKKKHIKIDKIENLKDLHTIAFQNAHLYLGTEFGKVAKISDKKYTEIADQKQQVYMLLKGRTEVVIMDRHIFNFYRNLLIHEQKVDKNIEVELIELFSPTAYKTAFKDEKIRDDFNEGIKYLKESGKYDEIYDIYSKKYFKVTK